MKPEIHKQFEKWKKKVKEEDLFRTPGMRKRRREQATYYQVKGLLMELLADEVGRVNASFSTKIETIILYVVRHSGFFAKGEYYHVFAARWINTVLLLEDLRLIYPDSPRFVDMVNKEVV